MAMATTPIRWKHTAGLVVIWAVIASAAQAQLVWTGSGGSTAIDNGGNWATGTAVLNGGTSASFGSSPTLTTAAVNVNAAFRQTSTTPSVTFTRSFTLQSGSGSFTVFGSHSGVQTVVQVNSAASSVVVEPKVNVRVTSPSSNPLGNLLVMTVNNTTSSGTALNIQGGLGVAAGSSGTTFDIRYGNNVAAGTRAATTRIGGPITGLGTLANGNPGSGQWTGDLVIAGSQSLGSSNIGISASAGYGTPQATARIVLGETASDEQTWNNVTLNNTMAVAVSGTATINALTGTSPNGRLTGNNIAGATVRLSSGSAGAVVIGGTGLGWNTLDLVKQNAGTLTIAGTHTYAGSTSVNGGTLNLLANVQLATSGIAVNNGGTLATAATLPGVPVTVGGGGVLGGEGSVGGLSFFSGTSTFSFNPSTTEAFAAASVSTDPAAEVLLTPSAATTTGSTYLVLTNAAGFAGGVVPSQFVASARGSLSLAASDTQLVFTPTTAATLAWTGTNAGSPGAWNTAVTANWSAAGVSERFYANDSVSFDDSATTTTISVDGASVVPGQVAFANATKPYVLSGGAIAASGTVTKVGDAPVTLSSSLRATGDVVVAAGSLAVNGPANAFGGLTVTGGTLALAAATNTFTSGSIAVTGGLLQFSGTANGAIAGVLGQRPVSLGAGTLAYSGSATQTNDTQTFTMDASGGTVRVDAPAATTWRIGGKVSGAGDWTKSGAGVLALGRNSDAGPGNDFSGRLSVTAGTLDVRQSDSLGTSGSSANGTEFANAALLIQNFGQTTGGGVTVAETLGFTGTSAVSSLLQESKTFTNRLTGPMSVSGTLAVAAVSGTGLSGAASMTLVLDGDVSTAAGSRLEFGSVGAAPVVLADQRFPVVVNGVISGGAAVVTTASGSYTLAAANTYTGDTRPQAGTLILSHTAALAGSTLDLRAGDTGTVVFGAGVGTYTLGGLSGARAVDATGSTLAVGGNGATTTYSGTIANGTLRKQGLGRLVLTGSGGVSGTTTVAAGTLEAGSPQALTAASVAVGSGATLTIAPYQSTSVAGLDFAGGGRVDVVNGVITVAGGLSATQVVAGILAGRADGTWSGTSGITSSVVQADVAQSVPRAVGWLDNGDGSVTFGYAAPGDTNLDWSIDILDAANFFAGGKYDSGLPASWSEGDFGYDGLVDILDAADFFSTGLFDAGSYNTAPGLASSVAAVPEPAGLGWLAGLVAITAGAWSARRRAAATVVAAAVVVAASTAMAQVTWDAGGGADTNINTATNWTNDVVNPLNGSTNAVFGANGSTATINVNAAFRPFSGTNALDFTRNFTLAAGAGDLTAYASNSGANGVLRTTSGAAAVVINETLNVFATTPASSPLGNLLVITVNNTTASGTALNLTAGLALAAGSSGASYDIRYGNNVAAGTRAATTRIAGTIAGLGTLANGNPGSGQWTGDLVIAGSQSLGTSNIGISASTGYGTPQATARIVLGEAVGDVQTWNNVTLNNTMNVAVSGTATINSVSGTGANARFTGNNIAGATLRITSGSAGTGGVMFGGTGTGWNTLDVVKQNAGTLTVSGSHTYSGSTSVNGGTLNLLASAQLSTSGITVTNGGTLANAATGLTVPVAVAAGGAVSGEGTTGNLTFGSGTTTFTYDPATGGAWTASSVTATAGGLVLLTPSAATVTGSTYLVMTNSAGFSGGVPASFTPSARGSLALASSDTQLTFTPTAAATLAWTGSASPDPTYWNTINTANWTLGAQAERFYSGDAVVFDDTATGTSVEIQGGNVSPGNVTFSNAAKDFTFSTGNAIVGSGTVTKSGAGAVALGTNLQNTGGIIVNAGSLSLNGAANTITGITMSGGTLALASSAVNTFTSGTIGISGGELRFSNTVANSLGARPVTLNGGTITYGGSSTTTNDTQTVSIEAGGGVKVDTATNITWRVGGQVSGTGDWTKAGAGVLSLGRNSNTGPGNTFSGKLTVTEGTLDIRHADSLGASGSTTNGTEIQAAILLMQTFGQTSGTTIVVPETLSFSGASFLTALNQEAKTFTDRFTGPMTVSGTLGVGTAVTSGATVPALELNGGIALAANSTLSLGGLGSLPVATASAPQSVAVNGAISGAGAVVTTSAGTYALNAANTFSGDTRLVAGTLSLGNAAALAGSTLDLDVADAGAVSFGLSGTTYPLGGLKGGRALDGGGNTLAIGGNTLTTTYAGGLSNMSLTKAGSGILVLAGTSSYTGATTVASGTLAVNGALGATSVTVASGGVLGGGGAVGGPVTVLAGGALSAGSSIESLRVGPLSLASASTFVEEVDSAATRATAADLAAVSGGLTISSGAILTLTELGAGSWSQGEKLTLISYTGTWNGGVFTYGGNPLANNDTFTFSTAQWRITYDDPQKGLNFPADATGTYVTITVVPEPAAGSVGLMTMIAGGWMMRCRPRRTDRSTR
jgi:autotransporter-associated beta strand protein